MAQSGSASALGAEGRGFESLCPDHPARVPHGKHIAPNGFSAHRIRTPERQTIGFDDLEVLRQVDRPKGDPAGARRVRAE